MGIQHVRLTREVTYGTFQADAPATDTIEVFLPQNNANTVRAVPQFSTLRDSGLGNRMVSKEPGRMDVMGSINTVMFPSQALFLLNLAANLTGSAPCYKLPSFTLDHAIFDDAGACTGDYGRYPGCRFGGFTLTCDDSAEGSKLMVKADVIGTRRIAIDVDDYPTPEGSAYPDEPYYQLYHTDTRLTIGTVRTDYKSLTIDIKNMLKGFGGESRYNKRVEWFGRDVSLTAKLLRTGNADRLDYENGVKKAVSVEFVLGAHSMKVDLQGKCVIDPVEDDFPLDDFFTHTLSLGALVDPAPTVPTDMTITVS
jgi:hypothetical protein